MPLRQFITKLSPRQWAMIGGAAAVVIVFLVVVLQMASAPSYSTLLTGLDPAQTGKITSTLDTKGISYELQNNGTALAVESTKTAQARVALATAGLLGSAQPGFSLFDKQQLGSSNFQQQITYQRALEGQLAQTIESIQGVSSAQVQLVLPDPQDQLFADSTQPSTAAVLLSGSTSLDPSSVRGIAQLVTSSVPGLQSSKVTITDSTGQLLWPTADAAGAGGTGLLAKQAAQASYDAATAAQVNAMLTQTLGPGKAQVEVNADLNANQATSDALVYAKKGVPLQQQVQNESLNGGGTTGRRGRHDGEHSRVRRDGCNRVRVEVQEQDHEYDLRGQQDRHARGDRPREDQPAERRGAGRQDGARERDPVAAGGGQQRGRPERQAGGHDLLRADAVRQAGDHAAASPINPIAYAKYALAGLAAIIFLFFMRRALKKREQEQFAGQPTWVRELSAPRSLAALEAPAASTRRR